MTGLSIPLMMVMSGVVKGVTMERESGRTAVMVENSHRPLFLLKSLEFWVTSLSGASLLC